MASPVLRGECFTACILCELLAVDLVFVAEVDPTLNNVLFALEKLILSDPEPLCDRSTIGQQILDLLDLEDNSNV